jgi:hypothetical protein
MKTIRVKVIHSDGTEADYEVTCLFLPAEPLVLESRYDQIRITPPNT